MIGNLKEKDMAMLEERIKRQAKSRPPPAALNAAAQAAEPAAAAAPKAAAAAADRPKINPPAAERPAGGIR